jgi:hypothetical protein
MFNPYVRDRGGGGHRLKSKKNEAKRQHQFRHFNKKLNIQKLDKYQIYSVILKKEKSYLMTFITKNRDISRTNTIKLKKLLSLLRNKLLQNALKRNLSINRS